MLAAAGCNIATAKCLRFFFRRILFHSRPRGWTLPFDGTVAALDRDNLPDVALATGSVPLYFQPVVDIDGAPTGPCIDGGMRDYHLDQRYLESNDGIVLFPHLQRRIVPNWFDRYIDRRAPGADVTHSVLQIHPSEAFVRGLPGGRIPNRDDFKLFIDDPHERIRRWREVVAAGQRLSDHLVEDLEKDRIPDRVEPLER